ncbi:MAG: asnB, partial [Bryobacterales bacterium]|nr:asnB [Bryobacterales bacterium]
RQRLLLARDRLGIKPLYYTEQKGGFVFASEIKAILQHPRIEARLDPQALSHYLGMKFVPAPATMFAGIRALPPGHRLSCNASGVKIHEYWRVSYSRKPHDRTSEGEYMEQLEALLRESVGLHLASDVPFGAFLSGGLDSSTVVVLMSQLLNQPVKTFSVGFAGEGAASSELPWARLVAQHCGAEHNEILIGPQDLIANAAKVVWHLDQPVADNACLANYMVSDLAVRQVKMVLTGEGGDELFAGYARYSGERLSPLFRAIPRLGRRLALDALSHLPNLRRPKLALFALCQQSEAARFASWFPLFNQEMKSLLFSDLFKSQVGDLTSESVIARHLARTDADEPLNRMLAVDTELWLPDDLLARGDKMSMAASLEARVPLLDHRVVEFAGRLPPHLKLKGMTRKYLLKKVASKWLPERIINRKKEGFPMPFAEWFRRDARTFVRDMLAPEVIRRRGFLEARYVDGLLHEHETGLADHSPLIWGLLNLELWHQTFLDVSPAVQRQQNSSIVL